MGLGPTWIILSILNSFAAWKAGAAKETYRVCGDDLIGFWKYSTAMKYTTILERLGLVVNKSKSFFGHRGVFCERIVELRSPSTAVSKDIGHLSAVTAAKFIAGFSHSALCTASGLQKPEHLRHVAVESRRRLLPRGLGPGRIAHGGNGGGRTPIGKLAALLVRGPIRLAYEKPLPDEFKKAIYTAKQQGDVPVSELVILYRTRSRLLAQLQGKPTPVAPPIGKRKFAREANTRKRRHPRTTPSRLRKLILQSQLKSRDRKIALRLIRNGIPSSRGNLYRWLENVLSRPKAERFVSRDVAKQLLMSTCSLPWEFEAQHRIQ
jgi:hypothetical protein